ncbi:hypothetical protein IEQ34_018312 [Dendrobium chrysotoxum]|uniref:Uncharacterized protein n=1 Tax=Dendrobium chrysotoxum TaxID=161865 RepID=A0AAV7GE09_DENCH|nr:hypothetical protein IEQ34_018312 [Dendrobium chrysotoxum]
MNDISTWKLMPVGSFDLSESRFADLVVTIQLISSKGFRIQSILSYKSLRVGGSKNFIEEPNVDIINVVREFFSDGKEAVDNKCHVRGKWAPFSSMIINKINKIRDFEFHEYTSFLGTPINP